MTPTTPTRAAILALALSISGGPALAQETATPSGAGAASGTPTSLPRALPNPTPDDITRAITRGVELLLEMQETMEEGKPKAEWPYEGVYRVGRQIPIGYRVGGTAIVGMALLNAPGYADHPERREAVQRALRFVIDASNHPLMNPDYDGGYDVRGWGYTYRLLFLLDLKRAKAVPDAMTEEVENTIKWDIDAIQQTEIPRAGGWNYARGPGKEAVSPPSPFMTAPTLEALFNARAAGYEVDEGVVNRAVESLLRQRCETGSYVYAGRAPVERSEPVPGSVGRMLAAESTLYLCGKSTLLHVRGALDSFLTHWEWLDKRRAQQGTHVRPYGIAPYYFYYAHYYAARAIELLPQRERAEYRRRLAQLLFFVRLDDGSWNDRVFTRSRNYGTALSMMALLMPNMRPPAEWKSTETKQDAGG